MREVRVDCPQCGAHSAYLQSEYGDYTGLHIVFFQVPWKCPRCGYPEVKWTNWGMIYEPIQWVTTIKITDQNGDEIRLNDDLVVIRKPKEPPHLLEE